MPCRSISIGRSIGSLFSSLCSRFRRSRLSSPRVGGCTGRLIRSRGGWAGWALALSAQPVTRSPDGIPDTGKSSAMFNCTGPRTGGRLTMPIWNFPKESRGSYCAARAWGLSASRCKSWARGCRADRSGMPRTACCIRCRPICGCHVSDGPHRLQLLLDAPSVFADRTKVRQKIFITGLDDIGGDSVVE